MDQQQKALRARQLLEDPVLTEAHEASADTFHTEWLEANNVEDREAAWAKTHALGEVLGQLVWLAEQYEEPEDDEDAEPTPDIP